MNNSHHSSSSKWINILLGVLADVSKSWQIILFVTLVCGLGYDTYQSINYVPMYCCGATFAIKSSNSYYSDSSSDAEGLGETFTYIFQSNVFKKKIMENMGVDSLNGYYSASSYGSTNVLYVNAYSTSIKTAYDMMNALMDNYQEVSSLVVGSANIELLQDVTVPVAPYNSISHKRNIILFGGIGFVLSFAIFASLSFLKNTIKDKSEIESKLNLHLYGSLPKERKIVNFLKMERKRSILINQYSTSFQYVEAVKRIRSRIERHFSKHHGNVLMVTSSLENEGKSSVSVNLALSFAQAHQKVLLIDGDFRKPSDNFTLGMNQEGTGIEKVLVGEATIEDATVAVNNYMDCMFGYLQVEHIEDYIHSDAMDQLMNTVKEKYDMVIIDSAPSRFLSDSHLLSNYADGILLVVKQNYAKVSTIQTTIDKLSLSNTPIIGAIDNQYYRASFASGKYYGYRYGYNHYYKKSKPENSEDKED